MSQSQTELAGDVADGDVRTTDVLAGTPSEKPLPANVKLDIALRAQTGGEATGGADTPKAAAADPAPAKPAETMPPPTDIAKTVDAAIDGAPPTEPDPQRPANPASEAEQTTIARQTPSSDVEAKADAEQATRQGAVPTDTAETPRQASANAATAGPAAAPVETRTAHSEAATNPAQIDAETTHRSDLARADTANLDAVRTHSETDARSTSTRPAVDVDGVNALSQSSSASPVDRLLVSEAPTASIQTLAAASAAPSTQPALAPAQAAAATTQTVVAAPGDIVSIVSQSLSNEAERPDRIVVQLDPPELGRVSIDFKFDAQGLQYVTVTGESPEAMRQLRLMHFELLQALERHGLTGQDMSFQQHTPHQQTASTDAAVRSDTEPVAETQTLSAQLASLQTARPADLSGGGLDIRL